MCCCMFIPGKGLSKLQAAKELGNPVFTLRLYLKKLANDQMATTGYAQHRKVFNDEIGYDLA